MNSNVRKRCTNPFHREKACNNNESNLRKATKKCVEILTIREGSWLCSVCRQMANEKINALSTVKSSKGN